MTTKKNFSVNPNQSSSESLIKGYSSQHETNFHFRTKSFDCDGRNPWRA